MGNEGEVDKNEEPQITFETAFAQHPDIKEIFDNASNLIRDINERAQAMISAQEKGLAIPPSLEQAVANSQLMFARLIDSIASDMSAESDSLRRELLATIFSELIPTYAQMVYQSHITRVSMSDQRRPHERLLRETMAMLQRAMSSQKTIVTDLRRG